MKGPTKPGWYWVIFREGDEWTVDRANTHTGTGELWWWAYGGRVADREVVAFERLEPPSKTGAKPKTLPDDPRLHDRTDSTYVEPADPSPRSFLAKTRKHTDVRRNVAQSVPGRNKAAPTAERADTEGRGMAQESPSVPAGAFMLYGQRVIVSGVTKRGRGFSYSVANEATPKRIRFVPVTVWNKEAKPA